MKIFFWFFILCFVLATACNNAEKQPSSASDSAQKNTMHHSPSNTNTQKFQHLQFASNKDLVCGMPLSAGIEDTAVVNGKIYGFCSKECKDEFVKNKAAYLK